VKVPFSEITKGGLHTFVNNAEWLEVSGLNFFAQPQAEGTLRLIDQKTAVLDGAIKAGVNSVCSRCVDSLQFTIDSTFSYVFKVGLDESVFEKEIECSNEDFSTVYIDEPVININEVFEEQLILSIPEKLLCSKKCKGLCLKCGANLNREICSCENDYPESPFSVLKNLKK